MAASPPAGLFLSVIALAILVVACGGSDSSLTDAERKFNEAKEAVAAVELEKALALLTEAIEADPDFAQAYGNRGAVNRQLGRLDEAIKDATTAIELDPDVTTLANAYGNRAAALTGLGRFSEAVTDATRAIDLAPDLAKAYINRSLALANLGRLEEAVADNTKVIELDPDDENTLATAYLNRSVVN